MTAFTKINLSKLPPATIIEDANFEDVLADLKADFIGRYDDAEVVINLESDPVVKLLEVAAYREVILLNRINQAAKAVMLATAGDGDLENLAALIPLQRLDGESTEAFRARIQLAPEGFSTAGPRGGYEFHARSASPDVLDVYIGEPQPGSVDVYILFDSLVNDSTALLAEVNVALNNDEVRPLTDTVNVKPFTQVDFIIDAQMELAIGPDSTTVLAASNAAVHDYLLSRFRFGRDVTRAGLLAALFVEGVENVHLVSPAEDVVVQASEVAFVTEVTVVESAND